VCLRLKKFKEAYSALREALKYKNDSYRIWENYLLVSLKVNQLQEAIYAYQRVLDHKEKHVDHEVLAYLVDAAVEEVAAHTSEASKFLHKQLAELFGRLTSQVSTDPELWGTYQSFHQRMGRADKALELRWRQLRSVQVSGWEQDETQFVRVVRVLEALVDELHALHDTAGAYSLKLNLVSALKKCRDTFAQHADFATMTALLTRIEQLAG
jgi:tetratricopeptide (TPR) repeat protein